MIARIELGASLSKMCYHRNRYSNCIIVYYYCLLFIVSSLVAISTDLCNIIICDMDTRRIVRQFKGHSKRITDMVLINNYYYSYLLLLLLVYY